MTRLPLVVLLLAGCGVTEVVDRAPDGTPILIRSPQPDQDDLEELHARWGVGTVLDLRGEKPGADWYEEEKCGVEAIGARWVHIDISGRLTPSPLEVEQFLQLMEDPSGWPVLMHCEGGVHRTGVMTGLYRMQYQGWTADQAIEEMEDRGFDWTIHDRDALKRFLRSYRRDPARTLPERRASRPEHVPPPPARTAPPSEAPPPADRGPPAPAPGPPGRD